MVRITNSDVAVRATHAGQGAVRVAESSWVSARKARMRIAFLDDLWLGCGLSPRGLVEAAGSYASVAFASLGAFQIAIESDRKGRYRIFATAPSEPCVCN